MTRAGRPVGMGRLRGAERLTVRRVMAAATQTRAERIEGLVWDPHREPAGRWLNFGVTSEGSDA